MINGKLLEESRVKWQKANCLDWNRADHKSKRNILMHMTAMDDGWMSIINKCPLPPLHPSFPISIKYK
jgi:hypothetical protein